MTSPPLIPLVDLDRVNAPMMPDIVAATERVLRSGRYVSGPEADAFDAELADFVGARHAVSVGSGTAALHLMLLAAGIGPGDEVILPANTFWATVEAVVHSGAHPVLVDVLDRTANIDPDAVDAACTARTAAVIAVHLYGQPAAMTELRHVATRHGLLLFEDAAQAIGARWLDEPAGALALAAGFSFYPGKNLGAFGEAGAITTSDDQIAARARSLRNHGSVERYVHQDFGFNERIDEIQAAILRVKLAHLTTQQRQRDDAVVAYRALLDDVDGVTAIDVDVRAYSVSHLLVVRTPERDEVLQYLAQRGIGAAVHYPIPLHCQPAGEGLGQAGQFPVTERLAGQILSLPLFPGISRDEIERCVETLGTAVLTLGAGSGNREDFACT